MEKSQWLKKRTILCLIFLVHVLFNKCRKLFSKLFSLSSTAKQKISIIIMWTPIINILFPTKTFISKRFERNKHIKLYMRIMRYIFKYSIHPQINITIKRNNFSNRIFIPKKFSRHRLRKRNSIFFFQHVCRLSIHPRKGKDIEDTGISKIWIFAESLISIFQCSFK